MLPEEIKNKRILLSPLNWGMGHVSRCIPIVQQLIGQGNKVIIACNERQQEIFKMYFDDLEFIQHRDYPFQFKDKGNFRLDMFRSLPGLFRRLKTEKREVIKYVHSNQIDIIISDHRYGFKMAGIPSFIICHQLNLPLRGFEEFMNYFHRRLLSRFNTVWIPDFKNSSLAGELSRNKFNLNVHYIGPLSRFQLYNVPNEKTVDRVVVISGPTIYARQLYTEMITRFKNDEGNTSYLCPPDILTDESLNILYNWREIDLEIMRTKILVSRSGYSTIMDLFYLQIPFDLIPTPGQSEQEYLYNLHSNKKLISEVI